MTQVPSGGTAGEAASRARTKARLAYNDKNWVEHERETAQAEFWEAEASRYRANQPQPSGIKKDLIKAGIIITIAIMVLGGCIALVGAYKLQFSQDGSNSG